MKPDPYANEPTAPVDPETSRLYLEACDAAKSWQIEADRLKKMIDEQIGDAHAGLVDGRKLYTHRPEDRYAVARLLKENPELTQHYYHQVYKEEFNFELFSKAHPEIAEQYRVRSFRSLGDV
jgi:hypothetical protein